MYEQTGQSPSIRKTAVSEQSFLRQVFAWMFLGLGITAGIAIWFSGQSVAFLDAHPWAIFVAIVGQLVLVGILSFAIKHIPAQLAAILFCVYAAFTGFTFSIIISEFTTASVIGAFAGAAGLFAGMATYGYVTRKDLSGLGGILFGTLIGIVIASIAYLFTGGAVFNLIIGWAGVLIFSGLTAYDMQKIKEIAGQEIGNADAVQKAAIFGALQLYLDFINLFISLLRIFGSSDD